MKTIFQLMLLVVLTISCDGKYENVIDDSRIIGTWHRYSYTDSGTEVIETDSIVYHFLNDGRLIIKYFASQGASQPDDNFQFDLNEGILRYWNADYNIGEEKEIFLTESTLRIKMYPNYFYNLRKLF